MGLTKVRTNSNSYVFKGLLIIDKTLEEMNGVFTSRSFFVPCSQNTFNFSYTFE